LTIIRGLAAAGVAKSKTVRNKGGKTRYPPTVYRNVYDLNDTKLDRDRDGIACER
jgi:homospermidine synthase